MTRSLLQELVEDPPSPARQLQSLALLDKSVTLLSTISVEWDRRLFFLTETQLKHGDRTI